MIRHTTSNPSQKSVEASQAEAFIEHLVSCGLHQPLAALRAVMESLIRTPQDQPICRDTLEQALAKMENLAGNIGILMDLVATPDADPVAYSLEEIARMSVNGIGVTNRPRIMFATEGSELRLDLDARLISRSLMRILFASLQVQRETALLHVHSEEDKALFTVTFAIHQSAETQDAAIDQWIKDSDLNLAERDVELTGGHMQIDQPSDGHLRVTVSIPIRPLATTQSQRGAA